jgi:hypothetical protein
MNNSDILMVHHAAAGLYQMAVAQAVVVIFLLIVTAKVLHIYTKRKDLSLPLMALLTLAGFCSLLFIVLLNTFHLRGYVSLSEGMNLSLPLMVRYALMATRWLTILPLLMVLIVAFMITGLAVILIFALSRNEAIRGLMIRAMVFFNAITTLIVAGSMVSYLSLANLIELLFK